MGIPTPSRPLDVHRWSDYPELTNCLTDLVAEIEQCEERERRRSLSVANRLRDAVRCIVLDLYVAWSADPCCEIGIALGKEHFAKRTRYDALFLSYDTFRPAYEGLVKRGYVQVARKGFHDPKTGIGFVTRVRATPKLIYLLIGAGGLTPARLGFRNDRNAEETVILRDDSEGKNDIEYRDTKATKAMRSDLMRINTLLATYWLDLYVPDKELTAINVRMANANRVDEHQPPHIDFNAKRLRRIFNNGVWTEGGRFYGGWWQTIPREYRTRITINEKRTVEVDYSVMHPALMYAEVGAELEGDAYDIGVASVRRDLVKQTFHQLVNASGRIAPKSDFSEQGCGLSWKQLQERVKARHRPIAQFLGTGYGVHLQNKDAQIANRIMLRFLDMGYVCLPVHDSFIVHHGLEHDLAMIMADEFSKQVGAHISTKTKFGVTDVNASNSRDDIEIGELLIPTGEYAG